MSSAEPWRCERQPDGTVLDCETDHECVEANSFGGAPGTDYFCRRESGCSGRGKCTLASAGYGALSLVCGCDGVTYVNASWANAGGTNVAEAGACP